MSPEEKEFLKRTVALSEENNQILRSIQRSMRLGRLMSLLYWIFIIGSAVGAYYLIQPYLNQLTSMYSGAGDILDNLKQFGQ